MDHFIFKIIIFIYTWNFITHSGGIPMLNADKKYGPDVGDLNLSFPVHRDDLDDNEDHSHYIRRQAVAMDPLPQTEQTTRKIATLDDITLTASDRVWQPVKGSKYVFLVYSAYYDARHEPEPCLRIIGAHLTMPDPEESYYCHMWYTGSALEPVSQPATIEMIPEHQFLPYSACFVKCPLVNSSVPITVSVVRDIYNIPSNHLKVINNYSKKQDLQQLSVCVRPLHYDYNKTVELVEFLELYKILGASHFTLYNHSASPEVLCVLQSYVEAGEVTLMPWQIDLVSEMDIRTANMFAALNDCLYRNMYHYSNIAMVDFDEYILPQHNDTLLELLDFLDNRPGRNTVCSYVFKNAFFYLNWPDDLSITKDNPLTSKLVTLTKTRKKTKLYRYRDRSKYTFKPELVVVVGNHYVMQHTKEVVDENVDPTIATSQHYRKCEWGGEDCINTPSEVDRLAHRYATRLIERVTRKWNELNDICQLKELP